MNDAVYFAAIGIGVLIPVITLVCAIVVGLDREDSRPAWRDRFRVLFWITTSGALALDFLLILGWLVTSNGFWRASTPGEFSAPLLFDLGVVISMIVTLGSLLVVPLGWWTLARVGERKPIFVSALMLFLAVVGFIVIWLSDLLKYL